jgi:hypothetical protein
MQNKANREECQDKRLAASLRTGLACETKPILREQAGGGRQAGLHERPYETKPICRRGGRWAEPTLRKSEYRSRAKQSQFAWAEPNRSPAKEKGYARFPDNAKQGQLGRGFEFEVSGVKWEEPSFESSDFALQTPNLTLRAYPNNR